jgi:DNA mismatch repair protein MutL
MNTRLKYRPISLLPDVLRNQIAAGEVVERPASVLKELVENSLDAGATDIAVTLQDGGQTLLAVRDNGHGLPPSELKLAVTRHATSKLVSFAELLTMSSYGFRGEALPSIASVSDLYLESAFTANGASESGPDKPAAEAAFIRVCHGEISASGPSSLHEGTLITVRELFANVPARLKFLKSPATELKRCQETLVRLALACPEVSFSLSVGNETGGKRELLRLGAGLSLLERLSLIWPEQITQALIPFDAERYAVRVHGLASLPRFAQARGDRLLLYVNKRPVNDRLLLKALREAYKGRLTSREYPQSLLFVEMSPQEVDVNVHPAKSEVRFRDERSVFSAVFSTVERALLEHEPQFPQEPDRHFAAADFPQAAAPDGELPGAVPAGGTQNSGEIREQQAASAVCTSESGGAGRLFRSPMRPDGFWGSLDRPRLLDPPANFGGENFEDSRATEPTTDDDPTGLYIVREPAQAYSPDASFARLFPDSADSADIGPGAGAYPVRVESLLCLGQLADSYLIVLQKDTLLLIDQHAAHERVLLHVLEQQTGAAQGQLLAVPADLSLHPAEASRLQKLFPRLLRLGYSLESTAHGVSIRAVPPLLGRSRGIALLQDILAERTEGIDDMLHLMACRSAVKAGQRLTGDEAAGLLSRWLATPKRAYCPHGRPTVLSFSPAELEKMFKRKIT